MRLGDPSTPLTSSHEPEPHGIVETYQSVVGDIAVSVSRLIAVYESLTTVFERTLTAFKTLLLFLDPEAPTDNHEPTKIFAA